MTRLDFTQPPFDVLSANEREMLKRQTKICYLGKDEEISSDDLNYFYVILKGGIHQSFQNDETDEVHATMYSSDWFDGRKKPEKHLLKSSKHLDEDAQFSSIESTIPQLTDLYQTFESQDSIATNSLQSASDHNFNYQAIEDSLLLRVNPEAIDLLSKQNQDIKNLLSGDLTERMQAFSKRGKNHRNAVGNIDRPHTVSSNPKAESQQLMLQPVTAINMLKVHIISESASLFEAASTMTQAGLKHVLVKRLSSIDRHPTRSNQSNLGILTDADICRAVSDQVNMATTSCREYAKFKLHTIDHHQDVSEALLAMIRYRVHRLPVVNDNQDVIGVLGQTDLLAFLSHHSHLVTLQIEQADSIERLKEPVEQIGQYIREQHKNGIKISVISRMVQALNAQVFAKLWQLIVPDMVYENTCIIVMGSEGRGEQIMRTDQDNALILRNGFSHPDLAEYADIFNNTLAEMGYPLCDGQIMMNNPIWRLSLNRFKAQISTWFKQQEPEHSIWLASLLDASYVCGDERLLQSLRKQLMIAHRSADPMFIRSFAQAALQFGDVNQWWKKFMPLIGKPMPQDIDLKKAGIFPLVHGIRALALENDILESTSTKGRLEQLVRANVLSKNRAETLNEALEFFMARRLDIALATEDKLARQVDPTTLSALERDLLKECLNVVKSFKNEIRNRYQLEIN